MMVTRQEQIRGRLLEVKEDLAEVEQELQSTSLRPSKKRELRAEWRCLVDELRAEERQMTGGSSSAASTEKAILQCLRAVLQDHKRQRLETAATDLSEHCNYEAFRHLHLTYEPCHYLTEAIIEKWVGATPNPVDPLTWVAEREDDSAMLRHTQSYLQEHMCPEGVLCVCVASSSWLSLGVPWARVQTAPFTTNFLLLRLADCPHHITAESNLGGLYICGVLLPHILALARLTTAEELRRNAPACCAQAAAEHLAVNGISPLRRHLNMDIVVLVTDGDRSFLVHTPPGRHRLVQVAFAPDMTHAAALMRHLLSEANTTAGALQDADVSELWPPHKQRHDGIISFSSPAGVSAVDCISTSEVEESEASTAESQEMYAAEHSRSEVDSDSKNYKKHRFARAFALELDRLVPGLVPAVRII